MPSTVREDELDALEERLGLRLPPLYRQFLQSYHFYELLGLRFIAHPIGNWRDELGAAYEAYGGLIERGLIPFAEEPLLDAGPVCFDTRHSLEGGDCPVIFCDHEWAGTPREERPLFGSSRAMFACLDFMARSELDFLRHDPQREAPELLPEKQRLLAQFLALDPQGAGGAALDYWTAWGVDASQ